MLITMAILLVVATATTITLLSARMQRRPATQLMTIVMALSMKASMPMVMASQHAVVTAMTITRVSIRKLRKFAQTLVMTTVLV
jgi:hypothetical protein